MAANTADAGGITNELDVAGYAVESMLAYFTRLIERRRSEPEDDTI